MNITFEDLIINQNYRICLSENLVEYEGSPYYVNIILLKKYTPNLSFNFPKDKIAGERITFSVLAQFDNKSMKNPIENGVIRVYIYINGKYYRSSIVQTNEKGVASYRFISPVDTTNISIRAELYEGSYYEQTLTSENQMKIINFYEFIVNLILPTIIILIIATLVLIYFYKLYDERVNEKKRLLSELKNIDAIFVISKQTNKLSFFRYFHEKSEYNELLAIFDGNLEKETNKSIKTFIQQKFALNKYFLIVESRDLKLILISKKRLSKLLENKFNAFLRKINEILDKEDIISLSQTLNEKFKKVFKISLLLS